MVKQEKTKELEGYQTIGYQREAPHIMFSFFLFLLLLPWKTFSTPSFLCLFTASSMLLLYVSDLAQLIKSFRREALNNLEDDLLVFRF